ncbi:hypothetical protein BH09PLA1_BH09PLA1_34660 [soil metagenome]
MSAVRTATKKDVDRREKQPDATVRIFKPQPFKPRTRLFALLAVLNLIWIGVLVVMYFKTVHHARPLATPGAGEEIEIQSDKLLDELNPATRPGASDLPSAPR